MKLFYYYSFAQPVGKGFK